MARITKVEENGIENNRHMLMQDDDCGMNIEMAGHGGMDEDYGY